MSLHAQLTAETGGFDLNMCLDISEGEVVAVVGPNGAGKSTMLWALAGLLPLSDGLVTLNGHVLDDTKRGIHIPPEHRSIGTVFQDMLLLPHLSAVDNVAFGLRCRGTSRRDSRRQAMPWLALVGMEHRAGAHPNELSGGQAQRVALARALAVTPDMLLLDEPLSALDVGTRTDVRHDLQRALSTFSGVRLIITHDPTEALTLADRLVILENGRVTQTGTPADVTLRPQSPYVATFIGMNLLRGWGSGGHITLDGGRSLFVPEAPDGDIFALIHPRAVSLHTERPHGSPRNVWLGHVRTVDVTHDHVRVAVDTNPRIIAEITIAAMAELQVTIGQPLWISIKATEISAYPYDIQPSAAAGEIASTDHPTRR